MTPTTPGVGSWVAAASGGRRRSRSRVRVCHRGLPNDAQQLVSSEDPLALGDRLWTGSLLGGSDVCCGVDVEGREPFWPSSARDPCMFKSSASIVARRDSRMPRIGSLSVDDGGARGPEDAAAIARSGRRGRGSRPTCRRSPRTWASSRQTCRSRPMRRPWSLRWPRPPPPPPPPRRPSMRRRFCPLGSPRARPCRPELGRPRPLRMCWGGGSGAGRRRRAGGVSSGNEADLSGQTLAPKRAPPTIAPSRRCGMGRNGRRRGVARALPPGV